MIYFLYGADTYRSRKKLREIIAEYRKSSGSDLNFHGFNGGDTKAEKIKETLGTDSLFSSKKLITIDNPLVCEPWEALLALLRSNAQDADSLIFLWEEEILGKEKIERMEEIKKIATKVQEFKSLDDHNLVFWIQTEAAKKGLKLAPKEAEELARLGGDLWKIANEIEKLSLGNRVSQKSVLRGSIFDLGDALLLHPKQSLPALLSLLRGGYDEFELFSYASSHMRKLFLTKWFSEKREPIPASAGIHPFVAKKASAQVRTIPIKELSKKFLEYFEEDRKIKTGISGPRESLFSVLGGIKDSGK